MVQTRNQTKKIRRSPWVQMGTIALRQLLLEFLKDEGQDEVQTNDRSFEIPRWAVLLGAVGIAGLISIMISFSFC